MSLLRVDEVSLQLFLKSSYLVGVFWRTGCNTFLGPRTPPEFFCCFPCMCTFLRPRTPTEVFYFFVYFRIFCLFPMFLLLSSCRCALYPVSWLFCLLPFFGDQGLQAGLLLFHDYHPNLVCKLMWEALNSTVGTYIIGTYSVQAHVRNTRTAAVGTYVISTYSIQAHVRNTHTTEQ